MSAGFILTTDDGVVKAALNNEHGVEVSACGAVFLDPEALVPLFRSRSKNTNGHLFTVYIDEYDDSVNGGGYVGEGIAGHCFSQPQTDLSLTAVYRGYNPKTDDHLYTTDPAEIYVTDGAYQFEGLVFYVYSQSSNGDSLWRLRDPTGVHHILTANLIEYLNLIKPGSDWVDEGILGYVVPDTKLASDATAPLYAAYDPNDGSHFYTMDFDERQKATNTLGMKADGICCHLYKDGSQPAGTLSLFRAYNAAMNAHVYTTSQTELDELISLLGFKAEGVTGWVMPELQGGIVTRPRFGPPVANLRRVFGEFADNLLVPAPPQGLASSINYVMNNEIADTCQPIRGLSVEVDVLEDIVCASVDQGAKGFSVQVNCESIGSQIIGWQQYVITLWGPSLIGIVNNYYLGNNFSIIQYTSLLTIDDFTIPKGWKLKIDLSEDKNANIVGVTYSAFDAKGKRRAHETQMIDKIAGSHAIGVAPIGTCQVVLVGPINGEVATLSSGRGTFTYTTSAPMRPAGVFPPCVLDNTTTGELANSVYAPLPDERNVRFVQEFSVKAAGPGPGGPGPMPLSFIKRLAGVNRAPPLPPPPPEWLKSH